MSIVVFDRLPYGHAEEDSLLQGRKLLFGKRKVQRNGPLSIRLRCLCFPAIDRRQLVRGGEVRKLQSIIGSNSHEISTCQTSGGFRRTNFLQSQTTNLGVSSEKELRAYSTVVAATQCLLHVPLTRVKLGNKTQKFLRVQFFTGLFGKAFPIARLVRSHKNPFLKEGVATDVLFSASYSGFKTESEQYSTLRWKSPNMSC